jgi:hypothetical protein
MSIIPPFSLPESGFYPATQDASANAVLVLVAGRWQTLNVAYPRRLPIRASCETLAQVLQAWQFHHGQHSLFRRFPIYTSTSIWTYHLLRHNFCTIHSLVVIWFDTRWFAIASHCVPGRKMRAACPRIFGVFLAFDLTVTKFLYHANLLSAPTIPLRPA